MRVSVDTTLRLAEEPTSGHNRWHPDIEPLARVPQGEEITLETRDGIDGQLTAQSEHADAARLDLGLGHPLTGPLFIEGAGPGDVLEVDFIAFEPADFGVAAIIPGFGFLADLFDEPFVAKFRLADGFAYSDVMPGVAIPADIFPGNVGVAPSHQLMEKLRARETELAERGGAVAGQEPDAAVPALAAQGSPNRSAARDRRKSRHPRPRCGKPRLLPSSRTRRTVFDRRPSLRAGRRRDLRYGHRDVWRRDDALPCAQEAGVEATVSGL